MEIVMERRKIEVTPGIEVSSVWAVPEQFRAGISPALVLAHGAGSDMDHPFLSFVHEALARRGILTVKFNFPYIESGRKAPDHTPRLARTWRAVTQRVRADAKPGTLFLGGKSMGGRIATNVVADGEPAAGLVLLGYPLHPAGRLDSLRAEHLSRIDCPMLFVQGSRDPLCDLPTLRAVLTQLTAPVTLHLIDEADHSFKVPKRTGKTEPDIWEEIVETIASWLSQMEAVFDAFTDSEDYTFDKTVVPLRLAQHEGEKLVSRSQAKRVAHGFERFKRVELDFIGIEEIGQAFADEMFRVFATAHPGIRITPINVSPAVAQMIRRVESATGKPLN
jgi:uncharacterized protein